MAKKFLHDVDFDGKKVVAQTNKVPLTVQKDAVGNEVTALRLMSGTKEAARIRLPGASTTNIKIGTSSAGGEWLPWGMYDSLQLVDISDPGGSGGVTTVVNLAGALGLPVLRMIVKTSGGASDFDDSGATWGPGDASGIALGVAAGVNNLGQRATLIGRSAGKQNTGFGLSALGSYAGSSNNGDGVVAVGASAGSTNESTGAVLIGYGAGQAQNSTGAGIVAIGNSALNRNSGQGLVAIGYQAAERNTGNRIVAIGHRAHRGHLANNAPPDVTVSDVVVIGHEASATTDLTVQLGENAKTFKLGIGNSGYGAAGQVLKVNAAGTGVEWAAGGGGFTQSFAYVANTAHDVVHNLNKAYPQVSVWNETTKKMITADVVSKDANTITVTVSVAGAHTVVVS